MATPTDPQDARPRRIGPYRVHPASWIIPDVTGSDYDDLKADIERHGQRDPVELYEDKIIDKRGVLRACIDLGVKPKTKNITIAGSPVDYVVSKLKGRRMTAAQLACIAVLARAHYQALAKEQQRLAGGRRPLPDGPSGSNPAARTKKKHEGEWVSMAATALGAGINAVRAMDRVREDAPDVFREAHAGIIPTVDAATLLAETIVDKSLDPEHRDEILGDLRRLRKGPTSAGPPLARHVRERVAYLRRRKLADGLPDRPLRGRDYHLYAGDLLEVAEQRDERGELFIADASVDKIITDPPYDREALPAFDKLGSLAMRKLKPGGSLFVLSGSSYLPEVMGSLLRAGLSYQWVISWVATARTPVWDRGILSQAKLVLWFTRGEYAGKRILSDFVPVMNREKDLHVWQQDETATAELLQLVCNPDDLVLDPFCGSGTTGAACLSVGCRFLGVDADPNALKFTANRLELVAQFMAGVRVPAPPFSLDLYRSIFGADPPPDVEVAGTPSATRNRRSAQRTK